MFEKGAHFGTERGKVCGFDHRAMVPVVPGQGKPSGYLIWLRNETVKLGGDPVDPAISPLGLMQMNLTAGS